MSTPENGAAALMELGAARERAAVLRRLAESMHAISVKESNLPTSSNERACFTSARLAIGELLRQITTGVHRT